MRPLPFSFLFPLALYVFFEHSNGCTTGCKQTKTLAPETFFPQLLPYLRKFLLKKPAACTFICIYELAYFRIWVCPEKYMYMVFVVISFFTSDIVIWGNILKDLFCPAGNSIIKNLAAVLNHKYKMIVQQEYRMKKPAAYSATGFSFTLFLLIFSFNPSPEFIHEESPDQEQCNEHPHGNR